MFGGSISISFEITAQSGVGILQEWTKNDNFSNWTHFHFLHLFKIYKFAMIFDLFKQPLQEYSDRTVGFMMTLLLLI